MKAPYTQEEWDKQLKERTSRGRSAPNIRRRLTKTKRWNKEIESKINITSPDRRLLCGAQVGVQPDRTAYHLAQSRFTTIPAQQTGNLQNTRRGDADAKQEIQALYNRWRVARTLEPWP